MTVRVAMSNLFKSGYYVKSVELLATLETSTGWYFVMDTDGNIIKYETRKQLIAFGAMAINDIRSALWVPDPKSIRSRFVNAYRVSPKTLQVLEDEFKELDELYTSPPVGNPRFWKLKFQENREEICELLAKDRTNYVKLILPDTEAGLGRAAVAAQNFSLWDDPRKCAAYGYMSTYLYFYRERWMKFFGYLKKEKKTELLKFWYP